MKETICTITGLAGGFIAAIFVGWDSALATLVVFMGDSPQCGEMSRSDRGDGTVSVTINEYLLTKHNLNKIDMPSVSMEGKIIGITVHNTDWLTTATGTTPAEQYTRATVNGKLYILPHWAEFKKKVQSYMNSGSSAPATPSAKKIYRVRKTWADAKSQIGAFSSLENAKNTCKSGYTVFDEKGNAVFPAPKSYAKGEKITLNDAVLYVSATAATGTKRSGSYYIYDGNAVNGRYRITTKAEYCGKTSAGKYVTGWVNKSDML